MMHSDDINIGRILNRREIFQILGATLLAGCDPNSTDQHATITDRNLPDCIVRPAQIEGPFFKDVDLDRADIRIDPSTNAKSTGLPLHMKFQVFQLGREECIPLSSTRVDLWQCDIAGRYSAFWDQGEDLTKERFLRGYQMTDESGVARFTTIYPGWYQGRTTHLHFKIRTEVVGNRGYEFTSQLYFDDKVTDEVHSQSPYREYGVRRTRNSNDLIFRRSGEQLILELHPIEIGYETTFSIGLDLSMVG